MATRAFKSISPQELEAAFASAISALTNTGAEVSIGQWQDVTNVGDKFASQQRFSFQLALTVEKSKDDPTTPENRINTLVAALSDNGESKS